MAGNKVVTAITQIEEQRLSYNGISWDEWSTTNEPEITDGSVIEIGGALYNFSANEDIDSTAQWAGIGNDTIVYCYVVTGGGGATCTGVLSTTAPSWDEAKQGWYNGSDRCYGIIYKDSGGNYTQKTLLMTRDYGITYQGISFINSANADKILRFASDAYILWDESDDQLEFECKTEFNDTVHFNNTVDGDNTISGDAINKTSLTTGSQALGVGGTWTPPAGIYNINSTIANITLDLYIGGAWRNGGTSFQGLVACNGSHMRIREIGGGATTVYYQKLD